MFVFQGFPGAPGEDGKDGSPGVKVSLHVMDELMLMYSHLKSCRVHQDLVVNLGMLALLDHLL